MGDIPGGHYRLLIGTYTKGTSRGIYSVALDRATGALGAPELAAEAPNPTFIALSPDSRFLYAVCAGPAWLSSFRVDSASPRLIPVQIATADASPTPMTTAQQPTDKAARTRRSESMFRICRHPFVARDRRPGPTSWL